MRWLRIAAGVGLLAAACTGASEDPVDEYPPGSDTPPSDPNPDATPVVPGNDAGPDAPQPIVGKKVSSADVEIRGATSDGYLVALLDRDLAVWDPSTSTATVVAKDFETGTDDFVVRDRFVGVWVGTDVGATPLTLWAKTGGVQAPSAKANRLAIYPERGTDRYAYATPTAIPDVTHRDVRVATAGAGGGVIAINALDTGVIEPSCRATIAFGGGGLFVAGCPNGAATPSVTIWAVTGGASPTSTVLANSAPGAWLDHAHAHALVQDATSSYLRPLGSAGTRTIDEPVVQAAFSSDDTKLLYMTQSGVVKRTSATTATTAITLAPAALSIMALTSDARFAAIATTGTPADDDSDLVVVDANTPASPRTLATEKATPFGFSIDGTKLVYLANKGLGLEGTLYVADVVTAAAPVKLSDVAERIVFDGAVVYWQEYDKTAKASRLRAARVSNAAAIVEIDTGLDPLTALETVIGGKLFVGSKLGLWEYPAVTP